MLLPKREYKAISKIERMYNYTQLDPVKPQKVRLIVEALRCPNCGYEWIPRKDKIPTLCPSCSIRLLNEVEVGEDKVELSNELKEKLEYAERVINEGKKLEEELVKKIKDFILNIKDKYSSTARSEIVAFLTDILRTLGYSIETETKPKEQKEEIRLFKETPLGTIRIPVKKVTNFSGKRKIEEHPLDRLRRYIDEDY